MAHLIPVKMRPAAAELADTSPVLRPLLLNHIQSLWAHHLLDSFRLSLPVGLAADVASEVMAQAVVAAAEAVRGLEVQVAALERQDRAITEVAAMAHNGAEEAAVEAQEDSTAQAAVAYGHPRALLMHQEGQEGQEEVLPQRILAMEAQEGNYLVQVAQAAPESPLLHTGLDVASLRLAGRLL